jgi:hypothetical protein
LTSQKGQIIDVAGFKELHLVDFGVYTNFNLPNYAADGRRAEMRGLWLLWQSSFGRFCLTSIGSVLFPLNTSWPGRH